MRRAAGSRPRGSRGVVDHPAAALYFLRSVSGLIEEGGRWGASARTTGEDVEHLAGDVVPVRNVILEVLRDDLLREVSHPVSKLQVLCE